MKNEYKKYTEEDVLYLKEHYATKSNEEIAQELGLNVNQIYSKAQRLGLKKDTENLRAQSWTTEQVQWLKENHSIAIRKMQQHLKMGSYKIECKLIDLGLR